ncbi:hypothetical protein [Metasolibacillus sp.]|uniref:hypothetical protein n=1 Tax=Metasolibacillus sp. TaxID=2703680 RepID=UPI0025CE6D3B|nr:hypothetical protein [Metasolibacillus sp.]MCT6922825.1 hypothetical protein [Metasolibacillus sp.]MCT6938836.1 hypothetical protein [Metasolibacillus sp.]
MAKSEELKKKQKNLSLRPDIISKISLIAKERNLKYDADVVEYLVSSYFENQTEERQTLLAEIDGLIQNRLLEAVVEDVKRMRVILNVIDRDNKMMMEFWNHYFIMTGAKSLGSTEKLISVPMQEANQLVRERIAHSRQKKLDQELKRSVPNNQNH